MSCKHKWIRENPLEPRRRLAKCIRCGIVRYRHWKAATAYYSYIEFTPTGLKKRCTRKIKE